DWFHGEFGIDTTSSPFNGSASTRCLIYADSTLIFSNVFGTAAVPPTIANLNVSGANVLTIKLDGTGTAAQAFDIGNAYVLANAQAHNGFLNLAETTNPPAPGYIYGTPDGIHGIWQSNLATAVLVGMGSISNRFEYPRWYSITHDNGPEGGSWVDYNAGSETGPNAEQEGGQLQGSATGFMFLSLPPWCTNVQFYTMVESTAGNNLWTNAVTVRYWSATTGTQ